ncbi:MAG: hypothetical protein GDA46_02845 [Bdellovibrionales bacterium]|nr:hypothetical protein [Bdellovibrionales bacterium]
MLDLKKNNYNLKEVKLFIPFFFFFISSCFSSSEESSRFRNDRAKTEGRKRNVETKESDSYSEVDSKSNEKEKATSSKEKSILSNFLNFSQAYNDLISLHIKSDDNKKIQIFPKLKANKSLAILSPYKNLISVKDRGEDYHLVLKKEIESLNLLFKKPGTTLKVKDKDQVQKGDIIAEIKGPYTFYVLSNDEEIATTLCLHKIDSNVTITKELPKENCN